MATTGLVTEQHLQAMDRSLDGICADQRANRTPAQRLDLVDFTLRVSQRLEAVSAVLVAEADAADASVVVKGTPLTSWLQMIGKLERKQAAGILFTGKDLVANPDVGGAAVSGKASVRQARAIVQTLKGLPDELDANQRAEATRLLVERAKADTAEVLRKAGPDVVAQVAPELVPEDPVEVAEARRRRAYARRFLRVAPDGDGAVGFAGSLPDLEAARFKKLIAAYRECDKRTPASGAIRSPRSVRGSSGTPMR